jgi:hypothetical protein
MNKEQFYLDHIESINEALSDLTDFFDLEPKVLSSINGIIALNMAALNVLKEEDDEVS